jgi:hypothetical protein
MNYNIWKNMMSRKLTVGLILSNVILAVGFIYLWRGLSVFGNSSSRKGAVQNIDPKTGESFYHKNQVKNTISKNSRGLQKCYEQFLAQKPAKKEGNLKIDWQITPTGAAAKIERVSNDFGDTEPAMALEKCAITAISSWEFPAPDSEKNIYVAHKFYFGQPKNSAPQMMNVK